MTQITESQYKALTKKIYDTLIDIDGMGMGEMGECRDESDRIADEWMEENNISFPQPKDESKEVKEGGEWFTGGELVAEPYGRSKFENMIKSGSRRVCLIDFGFLDDLSEANANLRLFIASKDMYLALKAAVSDYKFDGIISEETAKQIRLALKKANPHY